MLALPTYEQPRPRSVAVQLAHSCKVEHEWSRLNRPKKAATPRIHVASISPWSRRSAARRLATCCQMPAATRTPGATGTPSTGGASIALHF